MNKHRMISNRISHSSKFLQMPDDTKVLYMYCVLNADDDGVVELYIVMRLLGSSDDSLKILMAKGYLKPLNDDRVMVVTDWLEHNSIRSDRKIDSIYRPLIEKIYPEILLIEPKARSDVKNNSNRLTSGLSTVALSKGKVSKVSSIVSDETKELNKKVQLFIKYYLDEYKDKIHSEQQPKINASKEIPLIKRCIKEYGFEELKVLLDKYFASDDKFYQQKVYGLSLFLSTSVLNELRIRK